MAIHSPGPQNSVPISVVAGMFHGQFKAALIIIYTTKKFLFIPAGL